MAGLLDVLSPETLAMLNGASPGSGLLGGAAPTFGRGLFSGGFTTSPNEGVIDKVFGHGLGDPRSDAMMALSVGLMRGDAASGFEGANRAFAEARDRQERQRMGQLGLLKTGLELDNMIDSRKRQRGIRSDLDSLYRGQGDSGPVANAAPRFDAQPSGQFGTPNMGGVPMFSQAAPYGAVGGGYNLAQQIGVQPREPAPISNSSSQDTGAPQRASMGNSLTDKLLKEAQVYARWGDYDRADKLYEQAAKWQPEVKEIGVSMMGGKPVQVITYKDGRQQVSDFGPAPKTHWLDTGNAVQPIDEYTLDQRGQPFQKGMTPSDRISAGNLQIARERLALDRDAPQYMQTDGGLVALPKRPGAGPIVGQPVTGANGESLTSPKALTETQGKATTFAARMNDASKTIDELAGTVWPSTVARAGYRADMPDWLPGGQILGAGLTGLNQSTVPEDAQRYRQAQENWVTANLRQESGAAISKDEMDKDVRKWFPQPGEAQPVIDQKAAARRVAQEAMAAQAGPGAKQIPAILERAQSNAGQFRQAQPLPDNPSASTLRLGQMYKLPNGATATWDGFQFKAQK